LGDRDSYNRKTVLRSDNDYEQVSQGKKKISDQQDKIHSHKKKTKIGKGKKEFMPRGGLSAEGREVFKKLGGITT